MNKIKHDLIIDNDNPFASCKLDRSKYAYVLANIVNTYDKGFVMAINNKWGTGKTTFLTMWQKLLENKYQNRTLYFNAWENDFETNPLVAIISQLKSLEDGRSEVLFKKLVSKAASLSKTIAPSLVKAIFKKFIGNEAVEDLIKGISENITEIFEDEINEYVNRKDSIKSFKDELKIYVEKYGNGKPIVFIIDELDRCRPDYAVEVLEQIKHFFSVEGIVFVLAIDKEQLGHAVRGVYGSENIDTEEYLRRFIDLEYSIPEPSNNYYKYLYEYYNFDEIFSHYSQDDKDFFLNTIGSILDRNNLTLRQQEKMFAHTKVVVSSFSSGQPIFPDVLFLLIYIKFFKKELFSKIQQKTISYQELSDAFFDVLIDKSVKYDPNSILQLSRLEAKLLLMYHVFCTLELINSEKDIDLIKFPIFKTIGLKGGYLRDNNPNEYMKDLLKSVFREIYVSPGIKSLNYLLDRINLTERFK